MNERIKNLARQAAAVEGWGPEVWQTTFTEKFAELIVRECADIAANADLEDVDGGDGAVLRAASSQIKDRFGVK